MSFTPKHKTPNQETIKRLASVFVQSQITQQIGEEGANACLAIAVLLDQVLPLYRRYQQLVEQCTIDLSKLTEFIPPHIWARMNNEQKRKLQHAIEQEVVSTDRHIAGHVKYLTDNRQLLSVLGPNSQAALEHTRRQLMGLEEEERGQEGMAA